MPDTMWTDDNGEQHNINELIREVKELRHDSENHHARLDAVESEVGGSMMDDDSEDSGCRMELEELISRVDRLTTRVADAEDDLSNAKSELELQIEDARSESESADNTIKSDVDSLRHDVQYGR